MDRDGQTQKNHYIDGTSVRTMEAAPDYRRRRQERIDRENEAKERRKRRMIRRNQEKALRVSRSYLAFLTVAVTIFGVFAAAYIGIQSDVTNRMNTVANLESQISDLKAENDETYKRMTTAVDLESIKDKALNELGMSYAKESQIIYYSVEDDDYMNQYSSIPEK
jgi:cell division protein FtsL